MVIIEKNILML